MIAKVKKSLTKQLCTHWHLALLDGVSAIQSFTRDPKQCTLLNLRQAEAQANLLIHACNARVTDGKPVKMLVLIMQHVSDLEYQAGEVEWLTALQAAAC
jgi:hypothetical protein